MKARTLDTRHFDIPSVNGYVDFVSFLASLRSGYHAALKRISINQATAHRLADYIPEARLWPLNKHGVVLSFLHYKFYLDDSLENSKFAVTYRFIPHDSEADFPGAILGQRNEPSHLFNERYHS